MKTRNMKPETKLNCHSVTHSLLAFFLTNQYPEIRLKIVSRSIIKLYK